MDTQTIEGETKKLYYQLSDNGSSACEIVMELSGIMVWIEEDMKLYQEHEAPDIEYTVTPIWMTEEEYLNLPEADI